MELIHRDITDQIIGAMFEVYKTLGYGFLEKVYQNALGVELRLRNIKTEIEPFLKVYYKGEVVGEYRADLLVKDCVLCELKVAPTIEVRDEAQLLNELKASHIKVGLLLNFGRQKAEFKRLVM